MVESKIVKSSIPSKGTQLKVMLVLDGNQQVLFKPMRFPRDHIINGEPYAGSDRHNGEIVAFHLSRILNLRTAPITVGRRLHVTKELKSTASANLLATFLTQTDLTDCFYGRCLYCNQRDYICPNQKDGFLEGALVLMFPSRFRLERVRSPWQRTYKTKVKAKWEIDGLYCYNRVVPVLTIQRILDLIDTSIFDYLLGNADRHHYEIFRGTPESAILLIDNGKSFGNPFKDELSILAPLYQCCLVRRSTYRRLLTVEKNGLSNLIETFTRKDPLYPLLTGEHLFALDRRLKQILALIDICLDEKGESKVFQ